MALLAWIGRHFEAVALNPQPLPPKEINFADFLKGPADLVSLNPQPLPPKELGFSDLLKAASDLVSLNPQPLPPDPPPEATSAVFHFDRSAWVSLNPQPLPPEPPPEHLANFGGLGFLGEAVIEPPQLSFVLDLELPDLLPPSPC